MEALCSVRELADMREVFEIFAATDGKICVREVGDVLRALDENPTESDLKKITQKYQPDDKITLEEFLLMYEPISKHRLTETAEDFIESFRHFDTRGNGRIPYENIIELLTQHGEKLKTSEVEQLLQDHIDCQGYVNIEHFIHKIMELDEDGIDNDQK